MRCRTPCLAQGQGAADAGKHAVRHDWRFSKVARPQRDMGLGEGGGLRAEAFSRFNGLLGFVGQGGVFCFVVFRMFLVAFGGHLGTTNWVQNEPKVGQNDALNANLILVCFFQGIHGRLLGVFVVLFGAYFVMNSSRVEKMRHRENIGPAEWI